MIVDLHVHTDCSDGVYSPEEVTEKAARAGLSAISLTDHDTLTAYDGTHHLNPDIRIIPGIEMSSEYADGDVHILGYYIDTKNEELLEYCRDFSLRRLNRAVLMAQKCCEAGYDIDPCEVRTCVQKGGTVGRPHLARMLIKKGYFTDIKSVFDTLLYRGGPAYVPYERKTINECINLIHKAGGCAVLAHPSLVKKGLADVEAQPFDGIEVYHPKNKGRYDEFTALAEDRGLLISGGSDFHGTAGRFPEELGLFTVPAGKVTNLLAYEGTCKACKP